MEAMRDHEPPRNEQAPFAAKLAIVLFVLSYLTFALWLVADCWVGARHAAGWFANEPQTGPGFSDFLSAFYSVVGAILGCGVLAIVGFHKYVAVKRDFQTVHVWGYFVAPWLAAVLGLVVFALLQTGMLVFSGGASSEGGTPKNPQIANLGFLTTGFLAGFGWYEVVVRIRRLAQRLFKDPDEKGDDGDEGTTARIAKEGAPREVREPADPATKPGP